MRSWKKTNLIQFKIVSVQIKCWGWLKWTKKPFHRMLPLLSLSFSSCSTLFVMFVIFFQFCHTLFVMSLSAKVPLFLCCRHFVIMFSCICCVCHVLSVLSHTICHVNVCQVSRHLFLDFPDFDNRWGGQSSLVGVWDQSMIQTVGMLILGLLYWVGLNFQWNVDSKMDKQSLTEQHDRACLSISSGLTRLGGLEKLKGNSSLLWHVWGNTALLWTLPHHQMRFHFG